ncbi:IS630 family transposase [Parafrankia sp. FMc6]|uniref:IS630 family transposase n=1 Tax=Parafrankia soli TaxID=2599596 RepID=UPI0034D551C8
MAGLRPQALAGRGLQGVHRPVPDHDYHRHGTVDLFAALNTATGTVIGAVSAGHTARDFVGFLAEIDRQVEPNLAVHLICDNLSVHKAPTVRRWLVEHPRFALHFTPTYSSWLNQVERWFAELQRRCLARGVFCSVDELTHALEKWISHWNENARPFTWTRTADQIIDAIGHYCARISGPGLAVERYDRPHDVRVVVRIVDGFVHELDSVAR